MQVGKWETNHRLEIMTTLISLISRTRHHGCSSNKNKEASFLANKRNLSALSYPIHLEVHRICCKWARHMLCVCVQCRVTSGGHANDIARRHIEILSHAPLSHDVKVSRDRDIMTFQQVLWAMAPTCKMSRWNLTLEPNGFLIGNEPINTIHVKITTRK